MLPKSGTSRAVIESVQPEIDNGRFPIKRVVGEKVSVEADIFGDGHDVICATLLFKDSHDQTWTEVSMTPINNDRWTADFQVSQIGEARYTIIAWVDPFLSWLRDFKKRNATDADIEVNMQVGALLIQSASKATRGDVAGWLATRADYLLSKVPIELRIAAALEPELQEKMLPLAPKHHATKYENELKVTVEPVKARFSSWYELFPRSCSPQANEHGTFADVEAQLPRIARMGFDVLYLPPIHPIGVAFRKGKNNSPTCKPGDVGSPWGIGGKEGGHTAIHPQLGTLSDFQQLLKKADQHNIDIAMDIAYQCSPDHPWVREHPNWFRQRPDGSIQYAENPPKKYQDIYPIDFESSDWQGLWRALADVVFYWIQQGVRIFRVDNPHTKAFPFWEWMIGEVKAKHPEIIFLSEAFTRPKVMHRLAKVGFTQSYTYFTWRNTKEELTEYFSQMASSGVREYFRPNLWPNTPDILPEYLQWSGRAGFMGRLVLAATLGASYGIYGPAFELCVSEPILPGKEEYRDSEKYQITQWTMGGANDLTAFIGKVNQIRHQSTALQTDENLQFHDTDNPEIICFSKRDIKHGNTIIVVVNLDPHHQQSGWVNLNLEELGIQPGQNYQMQDLLGGGYYRWHGGKNFVLLKPEIVPAHIFQIHQNMRTEQDFDYFS